MKPQTFFANLIRPMYYRNSPEIAVTIIGIVAYKRVTHGVFKFEMHDPDGHIRGVKATWTSDEGATDVMVFDFALFLEHDRAKAGNPSLCDERPVYAWSTGYSDIDWYNAPPLTLEPLRTAIAEWIFTWAKRKP